MSNIFQRFRRDIAAIIWLVCALFLGLSLMSYNPQDPSFNSIGKSTIAENYCGYFGSFLADILLQLFGLATWSLVLFGIVMARKCYKGATLEINRSKFAWIVILLLTMAGLSALYFPELRIYKEQIRLGGFIGMATAEGLRRVFNFAGAAVLLWASALVLLVFYTEKPLRELLLVHQSILSFFKKLEFIKNAIGKLMQFIIPPPLATASASRAAFAASEEVGPTALTQEEPKTFTQQESMPEPEINVRRKVQMKAKVQRQVENWELPKISILEDPPVTRVRLDEKEIKNKAKLLVDKLGQFGVRGEVVGIKPGPAVTLFEFKPAADVKISRITDLADDLSLALSSESVRIIAPIPGRDVVGIETSNSLRESVYLKDLVADELFWSEECKLPLALGRQANGEPKIVDLRKMPHLLVAGSTGSGKSVFIVSILSGLLFRHSPKTLRLILVDPKQVDLAAFSEVPHLVMPPIREPRKAVGALRWAIREMEKRYRSMSKFGARGIDSFNNIVSELTNEDIEQHTQANEPLEGGRPNLESYYFQQLPYIVVVVEEFGDLMAVDKANVEQAVVRLAQMARACGIHLILAMQSPRKDVVTGLIKTNIPGRVSFKVASKMDSRIILDEGGAERLLARGDMLFLAPGVSKPERHHAPYLTEAEIADVVAHWNKQGAPDFDSVAMRAIEGSGGGYDLFDQEEGSGEDTFGDIKDEKYDEILAYVSTQKEISASLLQRRFRLGYPRAARMIEIFESEGVVGPANGSKPRQVLVKELR